METTDPFQATIARLASKAGVVATVVLEAQNGSIIQTSGNISLANSSDATKLSQSLPGARQLQDGSPAPSDLESLAAMVWKYVKDTEALISNLDSEDEVKLLRLRTRKQELVIAPDSKYILVVVHEVSGA